MIHKPLFFTAICLFLGHFQASSKQFLDKIIGKVGSEIVLSSELNIRLLQAQSEGIKTNECDMFQNIVFEKILIHQAQIDSIIVTEEQVEGNLEQRLDYFVKQIGSVERLEQYYGKSLRLIKREFRSSIKEQMTIQRMREEVLANISLTPKEIQNFYDTELHDTSIIVNSKAVLKHIVFKAEPSENSKKKAYNRAVELRERVVKGESLGKLAVLYSDDKASSRKRGELGYINRNTLVPEYRNAAYHLDSGEISEIVESEFGYHVIEMLGRRGKLINTRHILIKPKQGGEEIEKAKNLADSVFNLIASNEFTFEEAVLYFSDDEKTRLNEGIVKNQFTGESTFEIDALDSKTYLAINGTKEGDYTTPVEFLDDEKNILHKIIKVEELIAPHEVDIKTDYPFIKQMATERKKQSFLEHWAKEKYKTSFVEINPTYEKCPLTLLTEK